MIDQLISTMIPVTAVVLIGFAYAYNTHVNVSVANRLNTEIFLPALVFPHSPPGVSTPDSMAG